VSSSDHTRTSKTETSQAGINFKTKKCLNKNIKRIQKRLAQTESRIMMEFDSPHILKCYESFENSDIKLIIIEYCNEGTLKEKIQLNGKIPEA
jgi:serine/threonine protein kinase